LVEQNFSKAWRIGCISFNLR